MLSFQLARQHFGKIALFASITTLNFLDLLSHRRIAKSDSHQLARMETSPVLPADDPSTLPTAQPLSASRVRIEMIQTAIPLATARPVELLFPF
jgi:hypothetical protein